MMKIENDAGTERLKPALYILSGLPGTGKSTLGRALAEHRNAVYLRIDTIEQGLRDLCRIDVQGEGYRLAYLLAADNLKNGQDVVADCCNPIRLTRTEWESVARENGARFVNIEICCSDPVEHKERIDTRTAEIIGLQLPSWQEVQAREYHLRMEKHICIDTAGRTVEQCLQELMTQTDRFLRIEP